MRATVKVKRILWELIMKAKEEEEVTLEVLQEVVMVLREPVLWGQEVVMGLPEQPHKNPIWPLVAFKGLISLENKHL